MPIVDLIAKLSDNLIQKWYISLALAILCVIILITPSSVLMWLGLEVFVPANRGWISIALLISLVVPVGKILQFIADLIKSSFEERKRRRVIEERLQVLTVEEKVILSYFVENKARTVHLDFSNGTVNDLVEIGVLYQASKITHALTGFPYGINKWTWEYLKKHPELVQDEQKEQFMNEHPRFGKLKSPV